MKEIKKLDPNDVIRIHYDGPPPQPGKPLVPFVWSGEIDDDGNYIYVPAPPASADPCRSVAKKSQKNKERADR